MKRMRACENVIVTAKVRSKPLDMELPAFLSIRELTEKIDETLHNMPGQALSDEHCVGLTFQGRILDKDQTLGSCGIWDGSVIECTLGEEGVV